MNNNSIFLTNKKYIVFLFCLTTILIIPLIDNKNIPGHDYVFHVARIIDIAEALKEGVFPVRIYVDEVRFWGTPVGIFYPSLFCYIPALLRLVGVPVEICYNFFIILIFYMGAISSWYGFSILTRSKKTGFISAVLYISSGWFFTDAYIRHALGELLGLSFLPLAIACISEFITKSKIPVSIYFLGIVSISAIIESHVLTSVFLVFFSLFLVIVRYKLFSLIIFKRLAFISLTLFLLNATFIIPFLLYYIKVPIDMAFISDFSQEGWPLIILLTLLIFFNFWVFIALYFFLRTVFISYIGTSSFKKQFITKPLLSYYTKCFFTGLFFLFLSSDLMPWGFFYPLKSVFEIMQFPWRFLGIATLFFSLCGGFGLRMLFQKANFGRNTIMLLFVVICVTNLFVFSFLNPVPFGKIGEKIYWKRIKTNSDADYLYKHMDIKRLFAMNDHYKSNATISDWQKNLTTVSFSYFAKEDSAITLPLINYPGYIAKNQNGDQVDIVENNNHMIVIVLPKGEGKIAVSYQGLLLFKVADFISLLTLCLLTLYFLNTVHRQSFYKKKYLRNE